MIAVAGAGSAAAAAKRAAGVISLVGVSIIGLATVLIVFLCCVAVFGPHSHSKRAITVLTLLISRTEPPEPPTGGEARPNL
jgi:hypothetical protein